MEENEFKKLTANSRDWLIYQLLFKGSKATVSGEMTREEGAQYEKDHPDEFDKKGETSVEETITGKVTLVTDKAVLIGNADRVAWFPKSVILNLDKIVLEQNKTVELKVADWFKYKIEWKVPTQ